MGKRDVKEWLGLKIASFIFGMLDDDKLKVWYFMESAMDKRAILEMMQLQKL